MRCEIVHRDATYCSRLFEVRLNVCGCKSNRHVNNAFGISYCTTFETVDSCSGDDRFSVPVPVGFNLEDGIRQLFDDSERSGKE